MSIKTPLGKVRGHGSARSGTHHFWYQRVTAIALLPLTLWFVWAIVRYTGAPYSDVISFLSHPVSGVAMTMFVVAALFHMVLGLKVVIEDYIHSEGNKVALLAFVYFASVAVALTCIVAVLRIVV